MSCLIFNRILSFHYMMGSCSGARVREETSTLCTKRVARHLNQIQPENNLFLNWQDSITVINALKFMSRSCRSLITAMSD